MAEPIVCDTSVWLYLGQINQVELLKNLYEPVYTTEAVCIELDNGRINQPDILDPGQLSWVQTVQIEPHHIANLPTNRLGPGEQSVLAYALARQIGIVGLDDRQARNLAYQLGLQAIGTIGLLLKARNLGLVGPMRPLLKQLQQEGFYISESLLEFVLQRANKT
jgi:predicted nucleic acid-binding protein